MEDSIKIAEELILDVRSILATEIKRAKEVEKLLAPPAVQEMVLYRRDLEMARMRTGVALAYLKDEDPFRDRESEIATNQPNWQQPTTPVEGNEAK